MSPVISSFSINYKMLDVSPTVMPRRRRIRTDTANLIGILLLWAEHIQSVSEDILIVAFPHQDRQIEKKSPTKPILRQIQSEYGTPKNRVQDNLSCFETSLRIGDSLSQME